MTKGTQMMLDAGFEKVYIDDATEIWKETEYNRHTVGLYTDGTIFPDAMWLNKTQLKAILTRLEELENENV